MSPLASSIEEEELRVDSERKENERRRGLEERKWAIAKAVLTLSVSGITLILGVVLPFTNWFGNSPAFVWGLLLLPFGAWLLANTVMGGMGTGAWRQLLRFRTRYRYLTVKMADRLPEERNEILNPEEESETKDVRQDREKEKFD